MPLEALIHAGFNMTVALRTCTYQDRVARPKAPYPPPLPNDTCRGDRVIIIDCILQQLERQSARGPFLHE